MSVRSNLTTLRDLVETHTFFRIPLYQRLYVWGDEQVNTLLADLLDAYQEHKEILYLGGTLVMEREESDGGRILELIDGQQRFTTLWMLSHMWQEALAPFQYAQDKHPRRPRLTCGIRPEVDQFFADLEVDRFFDQWMGGPAALREGNQRLIQALAIIKDFPDSIGFRGS